METPKLYFNCDFVKKIGEIVAKTDGWKGMTVPRVGIFFLDAKKDVPQKLFKHEMKHWYDGYSKPLQFLLKLGGQYATVGYKNAPLEVAAREVENQPLTIEEKTTWDNA